MLLIIAFREVEQKSFNHHILRVDFHKAQETMKMIAVRMRHDPRSNDRLFNRAAGLQTVEQFTAIRLNVVTAVNDDEASVR